MYFVHSDHVSVDVTGVSSVISMRAVLTAAVALFALLFAAAQPAITDEDVKRMQEMFPTIEADVIRSVLEAARGNQEQAVGNLLSMTAD